MGGRDDGSTALAFRWVRHRAHRVIRQREATSMFVHEFSRSSALAVLFALGDDEFERDYLERVVGSRREMVSDIDHVLGSGGNQRDAVRELLRDLRSNLDADRRQAEAIRAATARK
jgi:hypothetical protein